MSSPGPPPDRDIRQCHITILASIVRLSLHLLRYDTCHTLLIMWFSDIPLSWGYRVIDQSWLGWGEWGDFPSLHIEISDDNHRGNRNIHGFWKPSEASCTGDAYLLRHVDTQCTPLELLCPTCCGQLNDHGKWLLLCMLASSWEMDAKASLSIRQRVEMHRMWSTAYEYGCLMLVANKHISIITLLSPLGMRCKHWDSCLAPLLQLILQSLSGDFQDLLQAW